MNTVKDLIEFFNRIEDKSREVKFYVNGKIHNIDSLIGNNCFEYILIGHDIPVEMSYERG